MIKVENLYHSYNKDDQYQVKDVSFEVEKGEIFGFLGPSGAGKSTVQNILTGLLQLLLLLFVTSLLSILVGFIQGLTNDDIISAEGSIKLLFLPLIAGVVLVLSAMVYIFLAPKIRKGLE